MPLRIKNGHRGNFYSLVTLRLRSLSLPLLLLLLLLFLIDGTNSSLVPLLISFGLRSFRWNHYFDCTRITFPSLQLDAQRGPLQCPFALSPNNFFQRRGCGHITLVVGRPPATPRRANAGCDSIPSFVSEICVCAGGSSPPLRFFPLPAFGEGMHMASMPHGFVSVDTCGSTKTLTACAARSLVSREGLPKSRLPSSGNDPISFSSPACCFSGHY